MYDLVLGQSLSDKFDDLLLKDMLDSFIPQAYLWALEHHIKLPEVDLDSQLAYLHIHDPAAFL